MLELCGDVRSLNCWLGLVSVTNRWCINHECLCHDAPYRENNIETCFSSSRGRSRSGEKPQLNLGPLTPTKTATLLMHKPCAPENVFHCHQLSVEAKNFKTAPKATRRNQLPLIHILQGLKNTSYITQPYHYVHLFNWALIQYGWPLVTHCTFCCTERVRKAANQLSSENQISFRQKLRRLRLGFSFFIRAWLVW